MTSNLLAALKSNQNKGNNQQVNSKLIDAAKSGDIQSCLQALSEPKVKVDDKDVDGTSALMHAAIGGYLDVVKFFVQKGARFQARDDGGENAMMKASKEGHVSIVEYLIQAAVATPKKGQSIGEEAKEKLQILKKRTVDAKDDEGITALMKAAEQGEGCHAIAIGSGGIC